jgi:hypothetical protein
MLRACSLGKSLKSGVPEIQSQAVWGGIFENSRDMIYDLKNVLFSKHFFSGINQLEKSPWKTGGGVRVTLFPPL